MIAIAVAAAVPAPASAAEVELMVVGKQHAFKVAEATDWSYLMPARLPRGRYVLAAYAIDRAFNRGTESRVGFRVR